MTDTETTPVPEQSREERLYIRVNEILNDGDEWVNTIPNWVPVVPSVCRGFFNHARALGHLIHRRDDQAQKVRFLDALGDAISDEWHSTGHYTRAALEAVGIYYAVNSLRPRVDHPESEPSDGPPSTPPPSRQKEQVGLKDKVKNYLDSVTIDEEAVLLVLKSADLLADFIPNEETRKKANNIVKTAISVVELRKERQKKDKPESVTSEPKPDTEKVDTEEVAKEAVKKAEEIIEKVEPEADKDPFKGEAYRPS